MLTCHYFMRHELPLAEARLALCGSLDMITVEAEPDIFGTWDC